MGTKRYEGIRDGERERIVITTDNGKHRKFELFREESDIDGRPYWTSGHIDCYQLIVEFAKGTYTATE